MRAEMAKGRRTAARKTALIAPLPFCLLGLMSSGLVTGGLGPGNAGFNTYGWCYWYTLLLPVAIALMTAGVAQVDMRLKLRAVMGAPVRLGSVWAAKTVYALMLTAASNAVMALVSSVIAFAGGVAAAAPESLAMAALLTAASIWMIPAGLFLTMRLGTLAGIALPLLAQLAGGICFYNSAWWWIFPPAAAMRLCSPFAGVAPSGVPLVAGEIYGVIDGAWVAALAVALTAGVALACAGCAWFRKQEAR
ncbi:MAG: hypothetical protein KH142_06830 [Slackia piriformis]|uniref:Lantibiotic ABC transporter permease n=1 Tax=Slackia piriformis TaxID=626934 RepID=A0A943UTT5_9ACTN|nr:hypothetical protein [Slackia piriformis]